MNDALVITIYECEGRDSYLCKVGGSPDTIRAEQNQTTATLPNGDPIILCANWPDVLARGRKLVLAAYIDLRNQHYSNDWFSIEQGKLDTRLLTKRRKGR